MAYDVVQAERLRRALADRKRLREQPMFGGLCFMLRGHMLCGIGRQGFMFRVGKEKEAAALMRPGASVVKFNGRHMRGFIWVDPKKCKARALHNWISLAESYIVALPAKDRQK